MNAHPTSAELQIAPTSRPPQFLDHYRRMPEKPLVNAAKCIPSKVYIVPQFRVTIIVFWYAKVCLFHPRSPAKLPLPWL